MPSEKVMKPVPQFQLARSRNTKGSTFHGPINWVYSATKILIPYSVLHSSNAGKQELPVAFSLLGLCEPTMGISIRLQITWLRSMSENRDQHDRASQAFHYIFQTHVNICRSRLPLCLRVIFAYACAWSYLACALAWQPLRLCLCPFH